MENASKALIFAASAIVSVMLLSFMVFMFGRFKDTAKSTEKDISQREIDAFNSKFLNYETGDKDREFSFMFNNAEITQTYDYILSQVSSKNEVYYNKSLKAISSNLNNISDVITAINDAFNINYKNNNGYKYDNLEIQNSVEIIVDLGDVLKNEFTFNKNFQYLLIEPNKDVNTKCIYSSNSISNSKNENVNLNIFKKSNEIKIYDMLKEFRDTKIIPDDNGKMCTVYKYYFFGETIINDFTGLIETVKFTLIKDRNF